MLVNNRRIRPARRFLKLTFLYSGYRLGCAITYTDFSFYLLKVKNQKYKGPIFILNFPYEKNKLKTTGMQYIIPKNFKRKSKLQNYFEFVCMNYYKAFLREKDVLA